MDLKVFCNHCISISERIQSNIDQLTNRYVSSEDPSDTFTNAIEPLLEQQLKILDIAKQFIKP